MLQFRLHVFSLVNGQQVYLMRLDGIPQSDLQPVLLEVQTWFTGFELLLVAEVMHGD